MQGDGRDPEGWGAGHPGRGGEVRGWEMWGSGRDPEEGRFSGRDPGHRHPGPYPRSCDLRAAVLAPEQCPLLTSSPARPLAFVSATVSPPLTAPRWQGHAS